MTDRVTIISSCENRQPDNCSKNYEPMSKRLVHSIRHNGGAYKDSTILMYYSKEAVPSHDTRQWLTINGCRLEEGPESLIPGEPVGNKTQACCAEVDTDYVLWLDSDMYVLDSQMFEKLIEKEVDVAATASEYSHHRWARFSDNSIWQKLYDLAEVDSPTENLTGGLDGKPVNFYFNSAVVLFRTGKSFPEIWRELAKKVRFSGIENTEHNFTQTSLTLAILKTKSSYEVLPQTYNAYYALEGKKSLERAILHYQDNEIDFDPRVVWCLD